MKPARAAWVFSGTCVLTVAIAWGVVEPLVGYPSAVLAIGPFRGPEKPSEIRVRTSQVGTGLKRIQTFHFPFREGALEEIRRAIVPLPDNEHGAVLGKDGWTLAVVRLADGKRTQEYVSKRSCRLTDVAVSRSTERSILVCSGGDGTLRVWNWKTGNERVFEVTRKARTPLASVGLSRDGSLCAVGGENGWVLLCDPSDGRIIHQFRAHSDGVSCLAFSPNGKWLVSGGEDKQILIWDCKTAKSIANLRHHRGPIRCIAFSPDGASLAAGSEDQVLSIWETTNWTLRHSIVAHKRMILAVAFSPRNDLLASAGADDRVCTWKVSTGSLQSTVEFGAGESAHSLAFSLQGDKLFLVTSQIEVFGVE